MSRNECMINAPASAVSEVLAEPSACAGWVVGTKETRRADPNRPAVGSHFDHEVGAGAHLRDNTKSLVAEQERRLVSSVQYRPFGTAEVAIELQPVGERATRVVLGERATDGPTARMPGLVSNAAFALRKQPVASSAGCVGRKRQDDR